MADHTCKWEHQDFFCRNFNSQRTCISNSMALTLTQPEIYKLRKFWPYVAHCANKYAKKKEKEEKEKNMTTSAIYHGALLATVSDYLQKDILL